MPSVRSALGIPTEAERVAVGSELVMELYRDLATKIEGVPRAFLHNVDETGYSDSADRREIRVLMLVSRRATSVLVPVHQHAKRSTFTARIGADGFRMRPFVILLCAAVEKDLAYSGDDCHNVALAS
jgi:hypothetical protein